MPLLQDLPIELLQQIMRYLLPDDVDSFSDACETFRIVTSGILPRHEELKKKYSQVTCGFVGGSTLYHPLFLLCEILQDSEIVWYVKAMLIGLGEDRITSHRRYEEIWRTAHQITVDYQDDIIKLVHACLGPYLWEEERESWIGEILSCDQKTLVALLAGTLPCLEEISFLGDYHPNRRLQKLGHRIAEENHSDPRTSHALSKLEYIKEGGNNAEELRQMILFESLPWLPSTRRYEGRYLRQHSVYGAPIESSITSLEFSNCLIRVPALRRIFENIANLEEFTYEHHWAYKGIGLEDYRLFWWKRWQPAKIILSLINFASHSLVKLDLTRNGMTETQCAREARMRIEGAAEDEGTDEEQGEWMFEEYLVREENYDLPKTFIYSLRRFQVLKDIRVQNEAFVEDYVENAARGRKLHPLVEILPASTEHVILALPQLCEEDSCRLIKGLPELKVERVPKLKSVIFESDKPEEWMRTVFKTDGTDLVLEEQGRRDEKGI